MSGAEPWIGSEEAPPRAAREGGPPQGGRGHIPHRAPALRAPGGRRPPLARLSEVDAPGQLPDDDQVDAVEDLRPERRGRDELRPGADGAEVGVEAEPLAEPEERLLGPHHRRRVVPPGTADGAEQDG